MYPQVLTKNRIPGRILNLSEYRNVGGYQTLSDVLARLSPEEVVTIIDEANLAGRGGAAFPMGMKLKTLPEDTSVPRYIICNADEMEPGTFKDRFLIHSNPHQLIEGMIISAWAAKTSIGIIFIRPEYESGAGILEAEIENARKAGFLGENILNSGFRFDIEVHRSGGRYICGEATALLNAMEGKRPNPRKPPPFPTVKGLWQRPSLVQNVETLSCVPHILQNGAEWFKSLSLTPEGTGTKLFSVSGHVNKPGCYELPMGVKLSEIIQEHAVGMKNGIPFKTCLPGGASTSFLPKAQYDIEMDFKSLGKVRNRLGTAALMVFNEDTCLLGVTINLMQFFSRESCGWCTPCREGLPYIKYLLEQIENGVDGAASLEILKSMQGQLRNAYCAFALGAAAPLESLLTVFEDEVQAHIDHGGCPFADRP